VVEGGEGEEISHTQSMGKLELGKGKTEIAKPSSEMAKGKTEIAKPETAPARGEPEITPVGGAAGAPEPEPETGTSYSGAAGPSRNSPLTGNSQSGNGASGNGPSGNSSGGPYGNSGAGGAALGGAAPTPIKIGAIVPSPPKINATASAPPAFGGENGQQQKGDGASAGNNSQPNNSPPNNIQPMPRSAASASPLHRFISSRGVEAQNGGGANSGNGGQNGGGANSGNGGHNGGGAHSGSGGQNGGGQNGGGANPGGAIPGRGGSPLGRGGGSPLRGNNNGYNNGYTNGHNNSPSIDGCTSPLGTMSLASERSHPWSLWGTSGQQGEGSEGLASPLTPAPLPPAANSNYPSAARAFSSPPAAPPSTSLFSSLHRQSAEAPSASLPYPSAAPPSSSPPPSFPPSAPRPSSPLREASPDTKRIISRGALRLPLPPTLASPVGRARGRKANRAARAKEAAGNGAGKGAGKEALDPDIDEDHSASEEAAALLHASFGSSAPGPRSKRGRRSKLARLRSQTQWEQASNHYVSRPRARHPGRAPEYKGGASRTPEYKGGPSRTPEYKGGASTPLLPPVTPSVAGGTPLSPVLEPRALDHHHPHPFKPPPPSPKKPGGGTPAPKNRRGRPPLKLDAVQSVEVSSFHDAEFTLTHCGSPRHARDPSTTRESLVFRAASTAAMCTWVSLLTELLDARTCAERVRRLQNVRAGGHGGGVGGSSRALPQRQTAVGVRGNVLTGRRMIHSDDSTGRATRKAY
jgi:hypothetical protein